MLKFGSFVPLQRQTQFSGISRFVIAYRTVVTHSVCDRSVLVTLWQTLSGQRAKVCGRASVRLPEEIPEATNNIQWNECIPT